MGEQNNPPSLYRYPTATATATTMPHATAAASRHPWRRPGSTDTPTERERWASAVGPGRIRGGRRRIRSSGSAPRRMHRQPCLVGERRAQLRATETSSPHPRARASRTRRTRSRWPWRRLAQRSSARGEPLGGTGRDPARARPQFPGGARTTLAAGTGGLAPPDRAFGNPPTHWQQVDQYRPSGPAVVPVINGRCRR